MTMTAKDLKTIDPALELMAEFGKISHNTSSHVMKMRQEAIFIEGFYPTK